MFKLRFGGCQGPKNRQLYFLRMRGCCLKQNTASMDTPLLCTLKKSNIFGRVTLCSGSIFLSSSFHNFANQVFYFHHILFQFISINQNSLLECVLYNKYQYFHSFFKEETSHTLKKTKL